MPSPNILVIRLGALGDLVLCCGAFAAIRAAHPDARIALLTMPTFEGFAQSMPWFDEVLVDQRAPGWRLDQWLKLVAEVKRFSPDRVYDLQGKTRQTVLFDLLGGPLWGPEWSGAAPGCSHPRLWPPVTGMHFVDFIDAQLTRTGIAVGAPNERLFSWLDGDIRSFALPPRFALLIPGCAPDRLYKRWPAESYAAVANKLAAEGIGSIAIGTAKEADAIQAIKQRTPDLIDLTGKTSLGQVTALARRAACVLGNDTGPTHLAAAAGGRTLALMSNKVNPVWSAPRGPKTAYLQGEPLEAMTVEQVMQSLAPMIAS